MLNFQLFDDTGSTKRRFTGGREREQICRQVKVLSSQQRISPEGSQTDSQPKLEGQIYTQLRRVKHYQDNHAGNTANLSSERYLTWFSQAVMRV